MDEPPPASTPIIHTALMIAILFLSIIAMVTTACMACFAWRDSGEASAPVPIPGYPLDQRQRQRQPAQIVRHPDGQLSIAVL